MRLRRRNLWMGAGAVLAAALGASLWLRSIAPPSVLFITLDTTRADRLGCYGYELAQTPALDALAGRGVVFERAYAPAPMTSPSHTSMMTGLWPPEHGVYTNGLISLDANIPTVAEAFERQGFDTAAFLSASMLRAKFGLNRGFRVYDDDLSTAAEDVDELHRYRDGRYAIDAALKWLGKRPSSTSPFFCWVHLYDPHEPYLPHPREFGDTFDERPYDGELAYVDRQLSRLFDALDKQKLTKNTVVVVVGDHGESLGEHGEEEHGYMLHESTLRVPLIIADPRQKSAGARVATPVSLVDLFPTLLEFGGVKPPERVQGRSLSPALQGKELTPRFCYSQTEEPYLQGFWSPLQGLTTDRWRYVRTTRPELYDLAADPRELVNLADELPDTVSELDGELAAFEATFQRRSGARVALSDQERRALESLGYAGGGAERPAADGSAELPDIKDMIGYLNRLQEAVHLMDRKKFEDAAEILQPLAEEVPNFLRARLNLGICRMEQEQYEEAIRWLDAALEVDPNSDRALDMLGFAYLKLRRLDEAERQFRRLLELQPDSEHGHLYLGEIHQRRQNFPEAIRQYEETLRINPQNVSARQALQALVQALRGR